MRLENLRLRNLRSLTDCSLSMDDVTIVLGPNGSGKSTLCELLRYALAGECGLTNGGGSGIARAVRHGAKSGSVELTADCLTVARNITPRGATVAVDGMTGNEARAALAVALPDPELLRCMLSSGHFVGLPGKEQQAVLAAIAGQPVDGAWVRAQLGDLADELKDALAGTNLTGPALLERLHATAYGMRTERNRVAKAAAAQVAGEAPTAPDEAALAQLQAARDKTAAKLAEAQQRLGAAAAQSDAHERAAGASEQAGQRLTRAREELRNLTVPETLDDEVMATLETELPAADEASQQAHYAAEHVGYRVTALEEQLERLTAQTDQCAMLNTITCPLTHEQRREAAEAARATLASLRDEHGELLEAYEAARQRLVALRQQAADAREARAEAERINQRRDGLAADIAQLSRENEAAVEAYQRTPAASRGTLAALVAEAQAADKRTATALQDAQDAKRAAEDWAKRQSAHEQASLAAERINEVVKALAPGGLPAAAMQETVGEVVGAVNRVLSEFTEFTLSIEAGEEFELAVASGGHVLPVILLSESERLRVGVALQVAFAHLTEFGFVVVDAADRLDTANRGPLIRMLLASGVQALVTATPLNVGRPQAEGLTVYDLTAAGTAERYAETAETAQEVA